MTTEIDYDDFCQMVEEYNKKDSIIKYGPYLYIGIAVISVFFS